MPTDAAPWPRRTDTNLLNCLHVTLSLSPWEPLVNEGVGFNSVHYHCMWYSTCFGSLNCLYFIHREYASIRISHVDVWCYTHYQQHKVALPISYLTPHHPTLFSSHTYLCCVLYFTVFRILILTKMQFWATVFRLWGLLYSFVAQVK